MTKEELEKEANKWADDMVWALVDMKRKANDDERDFLVQEYKDLQKRFTKELEAQIEKMKCCYNCSKDCGSIDRRICFENKMKDWELKK
jgi:hypothetical protein